MRNEQACMEAMPKRCGSINDHTKETIPDTKNWFFRISKQQTRGIMDTADTISSSTGKPDSNAKSMGNGNGRVINSMSRHRCRRQSGIEAILSNRIEIQPRGEVLSQLCSTGITKQQRAPNHSLHW